MPFHGVKQETGGPFGWVRRFSLWRRLGWGRGLIVDWEWRYSLAWRRSPQPFIQRNPLLIVPVVVPPLRSRAAGHNAGQRGIRDQSHNFLGANFIAIA